MLMSSIQMSSREHSLHPLQVFQALQRCQSLQKDTHAKADASVAAAGRLLTPQYQSAYDPILYIVNSRGFMLTCS